MSDQTVSRPPVANYVFLGFLTVHIYSECHRLRPAPLRRCIAHLGLCPFSIPGSLRGLDPEVHDALCYGHLRVVHELQTFPTHASGVCLQFLSLSTAQLSKWTHISDHFPPLVSGQRSETGDNPSIEKEWGWPQRLQVQQVKILQLSWDCAFEEHL